jgi:hypothetical protein
VREKFGVAPGLIPDFLALVGDAADGQWRGPTTAFAAWTERLGAPRLLERSRAARVT